MHENEVGRTEINGQHAVRRPVSQRCLCWHSQWRPSHLDLLPSTAPPGLIWITSVRPGKSSWLLLSRVAAIYVCGIAIMGAAGRGAAGGRAAGCFLAGTCSLHAMRPAGWPARVSPGSERSTSLISRTWNWPAAAMNQSLVDGWDGWRQDASQRHGARRRRRRRTIFHYDLRRLHRTTPQRWYCMSGPSAETVTGYVNSLKIEQALLTEIIICLQMRVWYRRQSIGHMWFPRLLVFHCNYISI